MKDRTRKNFTYCVVSRHGYPFPIDMLRYDDSIPASESDAGRIAETFERQGDTRGIVIQLRYAGTAGFITHARWESFGWAVESPWGTAIIKGDRQLVSIR